MSNPVEAPPSPPISTPPFLVRGAARGIDLVLQVGLMDAAARVAEVLPKGVLTLSEEVLVGLDLFVGLSAMVLVAAVAQWLGGATLGKLCTGLRVVDGDGHRITLRAALVREVLFFVDGLLLGLVAYSVMMRSERAQRLGDQAAGTYVVWRGDAPEVAGGIAWRGWPAGLAIGLGWVVLSYLVAS